MAKIITVYTDRKHSLVNMSYIRWYRMSAALAALGHEVDMAVGGPRWWQVFGGLAAPDVPDAGVRKVDVGNVGWGDYDVVKASYDEGFGLLESHGGAGHPFIITRLGTVVGPRDTEGILFRGPERERIYKAQEKMSERCRFMAVLNDEARGLWRECFGRGDNVLVVPGAADSVIPSPGKDPFPQKHPVRCIFAGNLFWRKYAPDANAAVVKKLNTLGGLLAARGIRLFTMGTGDAKGLDPGFVTHLGAVPYEDTWNYFHHAHAGIELVKMGRFMHNNESSKIYHYLRAGLPVVSEDGIPNNHVATESGLGLISESGNLPEMATKIEEAIQSDWDRGRGIRYIIDNHTWERRAEIYDGIIRGIAPAQAHAQEKANERRTR
ncbi:MAG: hypothetical protein AB7V12_07185 [Candidatus Dadabacteria bacterium]